MIHWSGAESGGAETREAELHDVCVSSVRKPLIVVVGAAALRVRRFCS